MDLSSEWTINCIWDINPNSMSNPICRIHHTTLTQHSMLVIQDLQEVPKEALTREIAEKQLHDHCYCNCNKCFRARNFIANTKVNGPGLELEYKYPLLHVNEACKKLGM